MALLNLKYKNNMIIEYKEFIFLSKIDMGAYTHHYRKHSKFSSKYDLPTYRMLQKSLIEIKNNHTLV